MKNRPESHRRRGYVYVILVILVILCLWLFGWPIAKRVLLHQGESELFAGEGRVPGPPLSPESRPDKLPPATPPPSPHRP